MDDRYTYQVFSECCEELRSLYAQELNLVYERHTDFLSKHSFLQSKSVLSVIRKSYWENYHSLLIKYVLENRNGGRILRHFLQSSGVKTAWIDSVGIQAYNVETEHVILKQRYKSWNGKRIDLLICDDVNKWLIVVENKIMSSVRYSTENRTQLDIYKCYCESNKRWEGYEKVYVLLDYKDCSDNYEDWVSANYVNLFSAILNNRPDDSVVDDYLKTLFSILSPVESPQSLSEIRLFNREIIANI